MIGGEGGAFQAPQQRVGGGNTGSNEGRELEPLWWPSGLAQYCLSGFICWVPGQKVLQSLCSPPMGEAWDGACPDRWVDQHQDQKSKE